MCGSSLCTIVKDGENTDRSMPACTFTLSQTLHRITFLETAQDHLVISKLKTNYSVSKYEMFCCEILRTRFANQCKANAGKSKQQKKALPTTLFKSCCNSLPVKLCHGSKFSGNLVWPIRTNTLCF